MTNQEHRIRRGGSRLAEPVHSSGPRRSHDQPPRRGSNAPVRRPHDGPPRSSRTHRRKKPARRGRTALIVVCALLAVGAALFLVYRNWAKAPSLSEPSPGDFDGTQPYLSGDRKEGFYTFLIIGRDTGGGGNTDTLMLAAYDSVNQQAALMSIPRDTMVNVSWDVKKINSVYNMNRKGGDEAAVAALTGTVAGLVGFRPDFTITMEWEAVGAIVDAIGGVYFDVPFNMYYRDAYQDLFINQPAGYRLLTGSDAMQVVRWRKNNSGVSNPEGVDGSDLGRTRVQQDFIAATLKQCLQIKNVTRINEIAGVFTEYVSTELSVGNLVWFAEQALLGGFSTENLYACTMPSTPKSVYSRSYNSYLSYVVPQEDALLQTVNQYFNPYKTDVTIANLDLMRVDADGRVSSSTGVLRDSAAASSSPRPADAPVSTRPVDEEDLPPLESEDPVLPPEEPEPPVEEPAETPAEPSEEPPQEPPLEDPADTVPPEPDVTDGPVSDPGADTPPDDPGGPDAGAPLEPGGAESDGTAVDVETVVE